jgi:hypothetical protein
MPSAGAMTRSGGRWPAPGPFMAQFYSVRGYTGESEIRPLPSRPTGRTLAPATSIALYGCGMFCRASMLSKCRSFLMDSKSRSSTSIAEALISGTSLGPSRDIRGHGVSRYIPITRTSKGAIILHLHSQYRQRRVELEHTCDGDCAPR